ncbi:MAG: molybdate ABC transporter substrate-binding protein [Pseudolabrys sp.]
MSGQVAADTVILYAAGSLRAALTDVAAGFEVGTGHAVRATFRPSGTLKDAIMSGTPAHVFASANMEHPRTLAAAGRSGPVALFARNELCALVRPGLAVTPATLLDRLLDPQISVGTSTPTADPSGDYAFAAFKRADAAHPGAMAILERKAKRLTGAADSATPPAGRNVYGWHVAEGRADIFLTYRTNAMIAVADNPGQQIVALPDNLAIGADFGLTVLTGAPVAAHQFALFVLSETGQTLLARHGFAAPGLTHQGEQP